MRNYDKNMLQTRVHLSPQAREVILRKRNAAPLYYPENSPGVAAPQRYRKEIMSVFPDVGCLRLCEVGA